MPSRRQVSMAVTSRKLNPRFTRFTCLITLLLGFAIYSNTFQASFHFDDFRNIEENPYIRDLFHLRPLLENYTTRFLTYSTFAVNYHFGRFNIFGYHLLNTIIHLLTSLLVYAFVVLTVKTPHLKGRIADGHARTTALCASLLFLTHPIQTEAVTYIVQRLTSLATFFYLASVVLYVQARLTSRPFYYLGALATTLLGMFTKEITFTLPLMLLLYEFSFFGSWREQTKRRLLSLLPFLLTLLVIPLTVIQSNPAKVELKKSHTITLPVAGGADTS